MTESRTLHPEALTPLEIATGTALEPLRGPALTTPPRLGPTTREALEALLLQGMRTGRSSVSFSGGRDSSLILALACHVARREGFEDPVAITMRHPSEGSQETPWQELAISHLGVRDWEKVDAGDTGDLLGPDATTALRHFGIQFPANAYMHLAIARAAPPGTMFTGAGGDELLGGRAWRVARLLWRHERGLRRDDPARVGFALAPRWLRRYVGARRLPYPAPSWLQPHAWRQVRTLLAAQEVRTRLRWDVGALDFTRTRAVALSRQALTEVGSLCGIGIESPLMSSSFSAAFARQVGPGGPPSRAAAMHLLGGDVLPREIIERTTKAVFDGELWGPGFRRFADSWDSDSLPPDVARLVDVEVLRDLWRSPRPSRQHHDAGPASLARSAGGHSSASPEPPGAVRARSLSQ